jgi:hypothetical protein
MIFRIMMVIAEAGHLINPQSQSPNQNTKNLNTANSSPKKT